MNNNTSSELHVVRLTYDILYVKCSKGKTSLFTGSTETKVPEQVIQWASMPVTLQHTITEHLLK